jgi:hypothetical protein
MKSITKVIFYLLTISVGNLVSLRGATSADFKESEKANFLAPCKPSQELSSPEYWNLISTRLFLAPGSLGRVIEIPSFQPETVLSVDEFHDQPNTRRFAITLTAPSSNLFYTIPQPGPMIEIRPGVNVPDPRSTPPPRQKKTITVKKQIIPIDAAFALAIQKTWTAMLQKSQEPPRNGAILLCGSNEYFYSVKMPNGRMAYAKLPLVTKKLPDEFAFVGVQLMGYCEGNEKERLIGRANILRNLARINRQLGQH